jgi:uncharacterized protein (DUF362 family)
MSKVAVLKTNPQTVVDDYGRLMDLAGYGNFLPKDREAILKLNLSWSLYFPACSTEPWQLDGVLKKMTADGYKITAVENKTVVTNPWKGARLNKWLPILERHGLKFTPLTETEWITFQPKTCTDAMYEIFPEGFRIPKIFLGKSVCHLPTMKTHGHTTITGAMKNAFGGLITERRHQCHKKIHEILVDLLAMQKEIHPGIFAAMDGTVAGNGAGPRTMTPEIENFILASGDQVAIDAISAKMMGFDPMQIPFIKMAHDRGLGMGDVEQIEIVGEDISGVNFNFKTKKSPVIFWDQMFRKGRLKFFEKVLFHTSLFKIPIFMSAFYHDSVWYPIKGRRVINKFMKTEWGAAFQKY